MREMKITFTCPEGIAGTVLADLTERGVANIEFGLVVPVAHNKNAPRQAKENVKTRRSSKESARINKAAFDCIVVAGGQVATDTMSKEFKPAGRSAFYGAIRRLSERGLIVKNAERRWEAVMESYPGDA